MRLICNPKNQKLLDQIVPTFLELQFSLLAKTLRLDIVLNLIN